MSTINKISVGGAEYDIGIQADLASPSVIGSTNNTGSTITEGTYFYLNGILVKAKTDIANGATFTENTNYETVTTGGLNSLINPPDVLNATKWGNLDSTSVEITSTGAYYCAVAINSETAGSLAVYLQNTNGDYIAAVEGISNKAYQRACTPWIYIPKNKIIYARGYCTDVDNSGIMTCQPL